MPVGGRPKAVIVEPDKQFNFSVSNMLVDAADDGVHLKYRPIPCEKLPEIVIPVETTSPTAATEKVSQIMNKSVQESFSHSRKRTPAHAKRGSSMHSTRQKGQLTEDQSK
jgi:hypothetical protein